MNTPIVDPPYKARGKPTRPLPRILRSALWAICLSLFVAACGDPESDATMGLVLSEELEPGELEACEALEPAAEAASDEPLVLQDTGFPCVMVAMPPHSVITSPDPDAGPSPSRRLVQMESGRFVSTGQPTMEGRILQWDRDGSFLRAHGRRGEGPGEFAGGGDLLLFPGPNDTLFVVDDRSTWSAFDPDLSFVRSFRGTYSGRRQRTVHVTPARTVVTTGPVMSGGQGNGIHIMSLEGEALDYLDQLSLPAGFPDDGHFPRVSAFDPGSNTVWVAPPDGAPGDMILEEWTLDGELVRSIRREAPWLPDGGTSPMGNDPPMPVYADLHMDGDGLLWVFMTVRGEPGRSSLPVQGPTRDEARIAREYDARVEVIDVEAGVVLASMIIENPLDPPFEYVFPGTRTAYRVITDDLGLNTLEVFDIELRANRAR